MAANRQRAQHNGWRPAVAYCGGGYISSDAVCAARWWCDALSLSLRNARGSPLKVGIPGVCVLQFVNRRPLLLYNENSTFLRPGEHNQLTNAHVDHWRCLSWCCHGRAVTRPPQTGAPNNGSVEIPVEDYRFDRSQPGIVGQEVYGSGACFDMAMLERRHGARASVRADAAAAAPGEWRPGQYLWPRAISGRRGEAVIITVFYPHDKLVSELGGATAAIKTPPVIQAATTISPFKIKRVERRKDEHLDLWVFIGGSAALGTHETIVSAAPLPFLIHW